MLFNQFRKIAILALVASLPAHATFLGDPLGLLHGGTNATSAAAGLSNLGGLAKAGDTMSGDLGLAGSGVSASSVLVLDASSKVQRSIVVSLTELG